MTFEKRLQRAEQRLDAMKKAVPKKIGNYILANYKDPKGNKLNGPDDFKKYYKVISRKSDKKAKKPDDADKHSNVNKKLINNKPQF